MWTAHSLDALLHQIANQDPNQDPVLSCYLNLDPEGRQYFEQSVSQLRNGVDAAQRHSFDECVHAARHLWKAKQADSPAVAFFARGGQRMFFYQAPLARRVVHRVTAAKIPSLYGLSEIRDNFDRFSLLHILGDHTVLSHFELGRLEFRLGFRSAFRSAVWKECLVECMRRFADRNASQPNSQWLLAAPKEILEDCRSLLRRPVECIEIDPAADPVSVQELAVEHFRQSEELQSRHFAKSLIERSQRGLFVPLGPQPVLDALAAQSARALVLQARTPKDLALRWIRQDPDLFSFHDNAVWLAKRHRVHVEIVEESPLLAASGGSACLPVKK
jgi:hypothetical protein